MTRDILVVDDEPETARELMEALRSNGYSVRLAGGGRDALHLIESQPPDLVICDLEMPDIDGYAVMAETATRLHMPDLLFILAHNKWTKDNFLKSAGGRTADTHGTKPHTGRNVQELKAYVRQLFKVRDESAGDPQ